MDCGKGKFDLLAMKNEPSSFFNFRTPSPLKLTLKFCYVLYYVKKWHFLIFFTQFCEILTHKDVAEKITQNAKTPIFHHGSI